MNTPTLRVISPGLQATIQDLGRPGFLHTGMPQSGAQDFWALKVANELVGNDFGGHFGIQAKHPGAAGVEFLMGGLEVEALVPVSVAVAGCAISASVNSSAVEPYQSIDLAAGDRFRIDGVADGLRGYLAVNGGAAVETVLGSRSTYLRGGIGGLEGRAIKRNDVLCAYSPHLSEKRRAVDDFRRPGQLGSIRVVMGPQSHLFTDSALLTFLTGPWKMLPASDRMGFRFEGPALDFIASPDLPSAYQPPYIVDDFIPIGGIQTPSSGLIIAMGVDGPSLGGFTKIATVFSLDFSVLAQTRPGQEVSFAPIAWAEAYELSYEKQSLFGRDIVTIPYP